MRSIFKAVALSTSLLLSGCAAGMEGAGALSSNQELPSGFGFSSLASLHLSPGRTLFSNGRLATGIGDDSPIGKETHFRISKTSRLGNRWIACGVLSRGGYFSYGLGTVICSVISPNGSKVRIVALNRRGNEFQHDVSGTAKLIAVGQDVFRINHRGRAQDRWRLNIAGQFRQSLILSPDEVGTLSLIANGDCRLVRHRLMEDGRTQAIDTQSMPSRTCDINRLARDAVDDTLWVTMKGRHLAKVDPEAALLGLDNATEIDFESIQTFTVSDKLVMISTRNRDQLSTIFTYDDSGKLISSIDLKDRAVLGLVPDYRDPALTFVVIWDFSNPRFVYRTAPFSKDGAIVYDRDLAIAAP